jgi:hypothetical protein
MAASLDFIDQVARRRAAQKSASVSMRHQVIGKRQATHDMPRANGTRCIRTQGELQISHAGKSIGSPALNDMVQGDNLLDRKKSRILARVVFKAGFNGPTPFA